MKNSFKAAFPCSFGCIKTSTVAVQRCVWMDEWMDGCMDGCTDVGMDGWMDGWMDGLMNDAIGRRRECQLL